MELPSSLEKFMTDPRVGTAVLVAVGLAAILGVRHFARRTLSGKLSDNTTRYRTRKLVDFGSYVLVALFFATVFSDQLGGVTVAFGVAGAGIAFALQEVIASVAGWLAITFGNFYKIGDRVMLGGIRGDVIDIGVLRTTVFQVGDWVAGDLYNGRVVRVANSFVFKEPVYNYSADFPFLWDELTVPVRHGSDRAQTQALLQTVAEEVTGAYATTVQDTWDQMTRDYVIENARVQPMVTMTADENWLTYTVRYVTEFKKRRTTKDQLFRRILDEIDASNGAIGIASAAQEITLMRPSIVDVVLDRPSA